MGLEAKNIIMNEISLLTDQEQKFVYLIEKARNVPPFTSENQIDKYLIKGCMSKLWLVPSFKDGKMFFEIDSDAAIPKGIAAILAEIYSNMAPEEILDMPPTFLTDVGVEQHLSMNRRNGLANLYKQIRLYAMVYQLQSEG